MDNPVRAKLSFSAVASVENVIAVSLHTAAGLFAATGYCIGGSIWILLLRSISLHPLLSSRTREDMLILGGTVCLHYMGQALLPDWTQRVRYILLHAPFLIGAVTTALLLSKG